MTENARQAYYKRRLNHQFGPVYSLCEDGFMEHLDCNVNLFPSSFT